MKVIGGPLDGIWYRPKDEYEYRQGYSVALHVPNKVSVTADFVFDPDAIAEIVTMKIVVYTVRQMKYNHGVRGKGNKDDTSELWFLAPSDWSDWEAIEYQMRK